MRLLVHVEGQTEETFVDEILRPHLSGFGYTSVSSRLMGNARLRSRRGGVRVWSSVRDEIIKHLRHDLGAISTILVDYYGMPQSGGREWPGRSGAESLTSFHKADRVVKALLADLTMHYGPDFKSSRFVPYVLMYEFEALLFSDTVAFAKGIGAAHLEQQFAIIRSSYATPEDINDSSVSAPSKRILSLFPGYEKPLHGTLAALEIGLATIRQECPRFAEWLRTLEQLS